MENKNFLSLSTLFKSLSNTSFKLLTNYKELINLEARLAAQTFLVICILGLLMLIFLGSIWMCLLLLFWAYLIVLHVGLFTSLLIMLIINVLLFALMGIFIFKLKNNLTFPATRKQILGITHPTTEDSSHEKTQTKN